MDDLWQELKTYAMDYARSDRPLPLDEECDAWLRQALDRCSMTMPRDAFEFYSAELCQMVERYRSELAS